MKIGKIVLVLIVSALLAAVPVAAQSHDSLSGTSGEMETAVNGTVTGQVVNRTNGAETPGNLEVMLHVWNANDKDMEHGMTDGDGRFVFDDVAFEPGFLYAVTARYQDVPYFSTPRGVADGETRLDLEVPVFETTTEAGMVQMDGMYLFFEAGEGGLQIGEVYSLSNMGDRTVVGAASLDDGTPATIRFSLPPDAAGVTFPGNQSRFFLTADGFADTAPLLPGERSGQVIVSYFLPYEGSLTLNRPLLFPAGEINILLPTELGLSLTGDNLVEGERRDMGNGLVVDTYSVEAVKTGDAINLNLSGELTLPGGEPTVAESGSPGSQGLALGGIVLGLAIIGLGIWWYRRSANEAVPEFPEAFDEIVQEIAQLDIAHDEQVIDDELYELRRAALRAQARALLAQQAE